MKRLILNVLVLVLFMMGLFMVATGPSWAANFAGDQATYLDDDPNEPVAESQFAHDQISCLSDDPNESVPESHFTGERISYLSEDPNEAEDDNIPQE